MSPDGLKLVWVARREAHPRSREGARALTNEGCATRRAIPLAFGEGREEAKDGGPTRGLDQTMRVMTLGCLKSESGTSCRPPAHECRASSSASDPTAPMAGPAPGPTGRTALQIAAHRPTDRHRRFAYPTDRQFAP